MKDDDPSLTHKKHFVEEASLYFEQIGLPRMAGRILGWLLISNPAHQSAEELAISLQASKGSISSMTRLLIQHELVERTGLPGDRRDYFRLRPDIWKRLVRDRIEQITSLHHLAERGLGIIDNQTPEIQLRLQELFRLYTEIEQKFPTWLAQLENDQSHSR